MHDLVALESAHDRDFVHFQRQLGEETVGEVEAVANLPDVKVGLGAFVFFEVKRVDMRDGAGGLDDDAVCGPCRGGQRADSARAPSRLSVPYLTASRRVGRMSRTVFI